MKLNNLVLRALSGVVLVVVILAMIIYSRYSLVILMGIIALGSLSEFYKFVAKAHFKAQKCLGYFICLVLVVLNYLVASGLFDFKFLSLGLILALLPFVQELYKHEKNPLANVALTLTGVVYCSLGAVSMIHLSMLSGEFQPLLIIVFMLMVWTNDVGAYLVGMSIGKHRLFERHSPKKSWEGFFGGLIFTIALGVYFANYQGIDLIVGGGLGAVVSVTGVLGDLIESMFKRQVKLKDSGSIIPGHGGFLDRFDAFLLSAPFYLIYFINFIL